MEVSIQGKIKSVPDKVGRALIKMGRAKPVGDDHKMQHDRPNQVHSKSFLLRRDIMASSESEDVSQDDKSENDGDNSRKTEPKKRGRPRKYKRRDLTSED